MKNEFRYRNWGAVILGGMFGGLSTLMVIAWVFETPEKRQNELLFTLFYVVFVGIPAALAFFWGLRAQTIADETGVRWRSWGDWKRAKWEEIEDFYFNSASKKSHLCIVETAHGKFSFTEERTKGPSLSSLIAEKATRARVQKWEVKGLREVDGLSDTFIYRNTEKLWNPIASLFFWGFWLFWPFPRLAAGGAWTDELRATFLEMPPVFRILGVLLIGAVWLWIPFLMLRITWFGVRDSWVHWRDQIVISPEGISWTNGAKSIAANWQDVRELGLERTYWPLFTGWLETQSGGIPFSSGLSGVRRFFWLLHRHAPHLGADNWRPTYKEQTAISGKDGSRIFHYRTSLGRLFLALAYVYCGFPFFAHYMDSIQIHDDKAKLSPFWEAVFTLAAVLVAVWGTLCYFRSQLRVNDAGLEQIGPLDRKFIAWDDVQGFERNTKGTTFVRGSNTTIALRFLPPAGWEELEAEIKRRAINSQTKEWDDA